MLTKLICCGSLIALTLGDIDDQPSTLTIDDADSVFPAQVLMETFIDSTGELTLKEVEQIYYRGQFSNAQKKFETFANITGSIWFRLAIQNQISEPLILGFNEVFLEEITLYRGGPSGEWQSSSSGYLCPIQSRTLPFSRYTFEVSRQAGESVILFGAITAKSFQPKRFEAAVGSWRAMAAQSRNSEYLSISVLGFSIILLFYCAVTSIVIRDSLFFYFSIYVSAVTLLIMWSTGLSFEWFWPNSPEFNKYPVQLALFYLVQLWFVNRLLEIQQELPGLYKLSYAIYSVIAAMAFGVAMSPAFSLQLSIVVSITSSIYFLTCALMLIYQKVKIVFIFIIGWLPLFCTTVANILALTNVLPYSSQLGGHAFEFALAWELVFFLLVLGYRYNSIRDEKLRVENENIKIIHEQKALLRKMVFEQAEEIMLQNDQLVQSQEEIKAQNEKLEAQNKAYERLKELILKQNYELEAAVQRRTLQLAQSHDDLKRHLHQVEQFSFIAAHNLRAPVARILGLASILDQSIVVGKENILILDRIVECARDLDIIIHDLGAILDTQKNTSEKVEPVDIRELLDKILLRFESEAGKEGIKVVINAEAKQIMAVPAYIDSVLSNLISNSIKYRTGKKSPVIQITTEDLPSAWRIVIEDNGIGFDINLFSKKLFEPFQRFHTHREGKGLGMFLVKTQVVAMQGTIEVFSQPNEGTKVSIVIPKISLQRSA